MNGRSAPPRTARHRAVERDLAQVRALLDRLEIAWPSTARRAVPGLRRRADQLTDDLGRAAPTGAEGGDGADKLVQDALTTYAGALVRGAGLDDGLCGVAEKLLDEIAAADADWAGVPVILGPEDSFGPRSGVIHLRYPTDSVWTVPLVAHELGHHVAFALERQIQHGMHRRTGRPIEEMLEREKATADVSAWSHLNELFADVFATWTAGPAYACGLILIRLDHTAPGESTFQHPAPNARVTAVLRTLERIDAVGSPLAKPNAALAGRLAGWWTARAGPADSPADPLAGLLPSSADAIEGRVDELLTILGRDLLGARHQTTEAVDRIEELLLARDGDARLPAGPVRVLDVLTAAWRIRTRERPGVPAATLARRSKAICDRLVESAVPSPRKAT